MTDSVSPGPFPAQDPLVVILGPTASGKTQLALALGEQLRCEVISADSRQVYREMDIATAKPSAGERAALPHHLVDIINPDEPFHLGDYVRRANAAITATSAGGRLPLLVGGSAQYVWAIVEGWQVPAIPPDLELRSRLSERAQRSGPPALHDELRRVDPDAASVIHPNNVRRVVRALEIIARTNTLASAQRARRTPRTGTIILGLQAQRSELYGRIDARVDEMFERGLIEEVERLLGRGYDASLPSMSGIGYTQVVQFLGGKLSRTDAIARMKTATHRLARQQATWFRADDPRITWVAPGDVRAALGLIQSWRPTRESQSSGVVA